MDERRTAPVTGYCDPRFEAVGEAFADNFTTRGETGGAVCLAVDDVVVADLWGGWADADQTRPWGRDTLVNFFSVGKPLAALCVLQLVESDLVDLDAPVAAAWPEFAAAGKEGVTVAQVLSHRAGLPAVGPRLPAGAMLDWDRMCQALADQEPWWVPGEAHGYHVNTFGFLVGEIVRRLAGRTVGHVLRERVTGPLGADVHVGLGPGDLGRVADFLWADDPPEEVEPPGLSGDELMRHNTYFNPGGLSGAGVVNTEAWRRAEIPSTNGHGTARGVARVYQALAGGGALDGVRVVGRELLARATEEAAAGDDRVLGRPSRFGLGFQLTQAERPLGPNAAAFGHFGAGGALGFCDPDARVAFGYVMNQIGPSWQNERNRALIDAVYSSLGT